MTTVTPTARLVPLMRHCVLDFETRSEADIKKVGAHEYARHPSTEILCVAWRTAEKKKELATAPVKCFVRGGPELPELAEILRDPTTVLVAHNAFFEQAIVRYVLGIHLPPERWICTASLSRAYGLPGSLEQACEAAKLGFKKDMEGHRLMLRMSKPRKATKKDQSKWLETFEGLFRLAEYCRRDVEAETALYLKLPPLSPRERALWLLDQYINWRGIAVDRQLISEALALIDLETLRLNEETVDLTFGIIDTTKKVKALQDFVGVDNLRARTVADLLAETKLSPDQRRLLEIRQALSKTSTAKYTVLERRSRSDGRVRDMLVYHGATTGRWTSVGVQFQNLARPQFGETDLVAEYLRRGDHPMLALLCGDHMQTLSSMIRSALVASEGHRFFCADYNAIELRVLFWCAHHEDGLAMLRGGQDLYKQMAARVFGKPLVAINSYERLLGKKVILGCGYGMGWERFLGSCEEEGLKVDPEVAERAVAAYRELHWPVTKLWRQVERAACAAVEADGKAFYRGGNCKFYKVPKGGPLRVKLPSGRELLYHDARINFRTRFPGANPRPELTYYGVNQKTRRWVKEGTWGGKLVENCLGSATRVLTHRGWVPIVAVRAEDLVFDGETWVRHGGLLDQGEQEVGEWLGLVATADHLVKSGTTWRRLADLDDAMSQECLLLGRELVNSRSSVQALVNSPEPCASLHGLVAPSISTSVTGGLAKRSWRATGRRERVYDLANCGPRHRFVVLTSEGPVIVHNCIQAIARDLMASAMLRLDKHGYPIVLTVHDEILAERRFDDGGSLEEFERLMATLPVWAAGLPVKVEGWEGLRFRK